MGMPLHQALLAWGVLSSWGWRWLLGLSAIPLLGLLLLYPLIPESPYFLVVSGRPAQAQAVLARLARLNCGGKALPPGRLEGPKVRAPLRVHCAHKKSHAHA